MFSFVSKLDTITIGTFGNNLIVQVL